MINFKNFILINIIRTQSALVIGLLIILFFIKAGNIVLCDDIQALDTNLSIQQEENTEEEAKKEDYPLYTILIFALIFIAINYYVALDPVSDVGALVTGTSTDHIVTDPTNFNNYKPGLEPIVSKSASNASLDGVLETKVNG